MEARHLGSLAVLFVLVAFYVDSGCARCLLEKDLPVLSYLPVIIPTMPSPEFPFIPKVGFPSIGDHPGLPKIGLPGFPEPVVPRKPGVPEDPKPPEMPRCPEKPEEPEVPENPKVPKEPEAPQLPPITESVVPEAPKKPEEPVEPLSKWPPKEPKDLKFPFQMEGPDHPTAVIPPENIENGPFVIAGAP